MALKNNLRNGTLAMVGSGEYLPGMEDVDRYLLEQTPGPPRVVCLPTAAGKESKESISKWSWMGVEHFSHLGVDVKTLGVVDRATAMDADLAGQIDEANFVYLSGGSPGYLYETLVGTKAWEAISGVLTRGGVVAGCSAGAMIWGEAIPGFLPPPFGWKSGFDIVSGASIIPHYDELPGFLSWIFGTVNFTRPTLVGVEGYTALIAKDGGFEVKGKGGVVVWEKGRHKYTDGQQIPTKSA